MARRRGNAWGSTFLSVWDEDTAVLIGGDTLISLRGDGHQMIDHHVCEWGKLMILQGKETNADEGAALD